MDNATASNKRISALALEVIDAVREFIAAEIALIRHSISKAFAGKLSGIALLMVALGFVFLASVFFVLAVFYALSSWLGAPLGALATGIIALIVAAILGMMALARFRGKADRD